MTQCRTLENSSRSTALNYTITCGSTGDTDVNFTSHGPVVITRRYVDIMVVFSGSEDCSWGSVISTLHTGKSLLVMVHARNTHHTS